MMPLSEKIKVYSLATKDTTNICLNHYKYLDKSFNFFYTAPFERDSQCAFKN